MSEYDLVLVNKACCINNISLSVDRTISGNSGIPDFIEFLFCLKLTEYEPKPLSYGSMENVNVNQQQ